MRPPALPKLSWLATFCVASFALTPVRGAESRLGADAAKWEALVQKKLTQPPPQEGSVICVGSSHMANWSTLQEDLAPVQTYNMGIGGSRMRHAAELFIPRLVLPFKPRAVLLYEGSNDLAAGVQPAEILKSFQALYKQLHEALPQTRLYVLGVVPSPGKRFEKWDAIVELNHLLEGECAQNSWMRFLDTTSALLGKDGKPRAECFIPNDVHMSPAGYESWKSIIAPVLVPAESVAP